jgi:hypothetical protein
MNWNLDDDEAAEQMIDDLPDLVLIRKVSYETIYIYTYYARGDEVCMLCMPVVMCCTVLYCTVLYCTVLYCTVLYCTVLCCAVLCCVWVIETSVDA